MHIMQELGEGVCYARMRTIYLYTDADVTQRMQCPKHSTQSNANTCMAISSRKRKKTNCCAVYSSMANLCLLWLDSTFLGVYLEQNGRRFRLWRGLQLKRDNWVHRAVAAGPNYDESDTEPCLFALAATQGGKACCTPSMALRLRGGMPAGDAAADDAAAAAAEAAAKATQTGAAAFAAKCAVQDAAARAADAAAWAREKAELAAQAWAKAACHAEAAAKAKATAVAAAEEAANAAAAATVAQETANAAARQAAVAATRAEAAGASSSWRARPSPGGSSGTQPGRLPPVKAPPAEWRATVAQRAAAMMLAERASQAAAVAEEAVARARRATEQDGTAVEAAGEAARTAEAAMEAAGEAEAEAAAAFRPEIPRGDGGGGSGGSPGDGARRVETNG